MREWNEDDVKEWLAHTSGWRFSKIVLPEDKKDGKGLI